MPAHITLVRHVETVANTMRRWQGATDTPISPRGEQQAENLAKRLGEETPDILVSSDLPRAARTAAAIGVDFEADVRWREPDVGEWEGLTFDQIRAQWPGQLEALVRGDTDVAPGGGERLSDVAVRLNEAFADLVNRLGEDGSAIVVSHGLALLTLSADLLGRTRPAPLQMMGNAAISVFTVNHQGPQLVAYNDGSHLDEPHRNLRADTHVLLIRHGETDANVQGRWQGHGDWPLNDNGLRQARKLAPALPPVDALYSSPLARAKVTADIVAEHQGRSVRMEPGVKEIGFGAWENLTRDEIESADPDGVARLVGGEDVVRGGTGETFAAVQDRVTRAVDTIAERHRGGTAGVVSHGGATRAYLARLLGIPFAERNRIASLRNTAWARIGFGPRGAALSEWNAAPHLDRGEGEASWAKRRL